MRLLVGLSLCLIGATGKWVVGAQIATLRASETARLERKLSEFPLQIGPWTGVDIPPDERLQKTIADIKATDFLNRIYTHPSGERLSLWFNYSDRSLDQYHYPTVCLVGAGWSEDESQRKTFAVECPSTSQAMDDSVKRTPIVHFYFSRGPEQQVVHYWYYLIGEDPVDRSMRKLSTYARVFLRGRQNPSLTVELFSQSAAPNMALLDDFAGLVAKELAGWMPMGTQASAELGATY
jgi:hypothetical protein